MSAPRSRLLAVDDQTIEQLLAAERAVLVLTRSDCRPCAAYQREIRDLLRRDRFGDVLVGRLVLDRPGAAGFTRAHPWAASLQVLPYTLLYCRGERIEAFAAGRGGYLLDRVRELVRRCAPSPRHEEGC